MRLKTAFLFILLSIVAGCGFIESQKSNFDACMADIQCKTEAEGWQKKIENASVIVASGVPVPGAAAAPKLLGWIALAVAALIGGRSLTKKKVPPVPEPAP